MRLYWIRVRPNPITGVPYKVREILIHTQGREGRMKTETQREEGRQAEIKEASTAKEPRMVSDRLQLKEEEGRALP